MKTNGRIAYEAFHNTGNITWNGISTGSQEDWERAAKAVLERKTPGQLAHDAWYKRKGMRNASWEDTNNEDRAAWEAAAKAACDG